MAQKVDGWAVAIDPVTPATLYAVVYGGGVFKLSQNTLLTASSASFSTVECAGFKYNSETSSCLKKYPEKSSHRENLTLSNLSKWSRYSDNPDRFNSVKRLAGHGADYLIPEESLSRKCYCRSSGSP